MQELGNHADQDIAGNAMKYTMTGFVKIKLHYSSGQAILTVQDSGVGIPRMSSHGWRWNLLLLVCLGSDIHLIGERFHRVQSVSRCHEGTGIGLSLTKVSHFLIACKTGSVTEVSSTTGTHQSARRCSGD